MSKSLMDLINATTWHEATTWRTTFPHEYTWLVKHNNKELYELLAKRLLAGEGVQGVFFKAKPYYIFLGDYKYWFMGFVNHEKGTYDIDLVDHKEYVLNRCKLTRDYRDFTVKSYDDRPDYAEPMEVDK